jgi:hypothetical protein
VSNQDARNLHSATVAPMERGRGRLKHFLKLKPRSAKGLREPAAQVSKRHGRSPRATARRNIAYDQASAGKRDCTPGSPIRMEVMDEDPLP